MSDEYRLIIDFLNLGIWEIDYIKNNYEEDIDELSEKEIKKFDMYKKLFNDIFKKYNDFDLNRRSVRRLYDYEIFDNKDLLPLKNIEILELKGIGKKLSKNILEYKDLIKECYKLLVNRL